ncbi:MAG: hypothetical protein ACEQSE_05355 [Candidatus Aquirickettsiella gammari]
MSLSSPLMTAALVVAGSIVCSSNVKASAEVRMSSGSESAEFQTAPIQNAAELEARMQKGLPPLEALTPFGKREFLRGLLWGQKGLSTFSVKSMARELSADQIIALAGVFGIESYVQSLLSRAEKYPPLRLINPTKERVEHYYEMDDRRRREQTMIDDESGLSRQDFAPLLQEFDRRFGQDLKPHNLKALSDSDLVLVFDSVSSIAFVSLDAKLIGQQRQVFDELQRRGIDTRRDINQQVLQNMIRLREFNQAREFIVSHPDLQDTKIPHVDDQLGSNFTGRSVFAYDAETNTLRRQALRFENGKQLIMVVNSACEFSKRALAAIDEDVVFAKAVRQAKLVIVTPPSAAPPLFFISNWNAKHPDQTIRVAADRTEWQEIDKPGVPMFYLYENGKISKVIEGWQGQKTRDLLLQTLGIVEKAP